MKIKHNIQIHSQGENILLDVYLPKENKGKVILFCHGFKGFKDWGAWHLVAAFFANKGYTFIKFNFSHNGIGSEQLSEFTRLDLFRENNYSKEMTDVARVLSWIEQESDLLYDELAIIGHSRGGGIALLSAFENKGIHKVVTWASIAQFDRFGTDAEKALWRETGSKNFYNARTQQDMKIGYQFLEDYEQNKERLNIEKAVSGLQKPQLIIHGKNDEAVGFSGAQRLQKWNPMAELFLLENANHVFGAQHPFEGEILPEDLLAVCERTDVFLNKGS
jgi:pimeloyl-ACP methyl ester carboxylesterase